VGFGVRSGDGQTAQQNETEGAVHRVGLEGRECGATIRTLSGSVNNWSAARRSQYTATHFQRGDSAL
jgi:hypothetical protein